MGYPTYSVYRQPRGPSFKEVPEDWEVRRLKFAATYNDETLPEITDPDTEIAYVDISSVDLAKGITAVETLTFAEAPSRARRIVRDGDSIISTVRTYLKAIAAIKQPPKNTIVSTGFAVIRPVGFVDQRFLSYSLQNANFVNEVVANSTGVSYPTINPSSLVCINIAYPKAKKEQQKIADFLDWKTGQIDALIAKKKQLIEKLHEQRSAIITQAVTKGLNPDPSMRDSSIQWLGKVPEDWEVRRLKFAATYNDETLPETTDPDTEIAYVDISSVDLAKGITAVETLTFAEAPSRARRIVRDGDSIISTVRTYLKAIAAIKQPPKNTIVSTGFAVIRPVGFVDQRFLSYSLQNANFVNEVVANSTGVSYPTINPSSLVCINIAYPKAKKEQQKIADFLDWKTGQIDALIKLTSKAISLIIEYRTALITAGITGKIDVRNIKLGAIA